MNVAVVGMGHVGTTVAADLTKKGHRVTLLKTSNKLHCENYAALLKNRRVVVDDLDGTYAVELARATDDFETAIRGAELVIICVQTNYHKDVVRKIAPFIVDGQTFLIEPGYLSTCYFLQETDKDITIIEAESSPIDCRITEPGRVKVLFKNVLNPFGVYPKAREDKAREILARLEYPFVLTKNVVEAALHNPNLIVHTVGAIFSVPRIESLNGGEYWMYKEVFTPSVWNVVESLDAEKMNALERANCERIPYVEACKLRNSTDKNVDALEVFFDYARNSSPAGPFTSDSRYVTEDVPQGLCLLESLGAYLNVDTPTATSLINIASTALKTDFRRDGRTVDSLGWENIKKVLGAF